jgi:alpha-1,2-glucosyltransferase
MLNRIFLIMTLLYASHCRGFINRLSNPSASIVSPNTLHTAFNIALFPPLFFFSGLFYTDILSTCLVLRMYKMFLKGERGIWLYITGILALTMRQTNIFWVAVFMGGLEVVRTLQSIKPSETIEEQAKTWIGKLVPSFDRYARGEIHDVPLKDAGPQGSFSHPSLGND